MISLDYIVTAVIWPCIKIKKLIKIGESLCSHFNIEDERKHATFSAYCALLFQERLECNWNAKKKMCAVYGEGTVTDRMCQNWFAKFLGTNDILAK